MTPTLSQDPAIGPHSGCAKLRSKKKTLCSRADELFKRMALPALMQGAKSAKVRALIVRLGEGSRPGTGGARELAGQTANELASI
jgi:hypothetical protein